MPPKGSWAAVASANASAWRDTASKVPVVTRPPAPRVVPDTAVVKAPENEDRVSPGGKGTTSTGAARVVTVATGAVGCCGRGISTRGG